MKQELNIVALWYNSHIYTLKCLYILFIPLIQSSVFYSRRYGERRYISALQRAPVHSERRYMAADFPCFGGSNPYYFSINEFLWEAS